MNVKRVINQSRLCSLVASDQNKCVIVKIEERIKKKNRKKENIKFDTRRFRDLVRALIWKDDFRDDS